MPKIPTYPTLFDSTLQINVSNLKKWGYIIPGQIKSGVLKWSSNGAKTGSIDISVNYQNKNPFLKLNYTYNGNPRQYIIRLVSIPSNLGFGQIWYFLCPETKKRARVLYSIGGYFLHREAFNGCMYECQTKSKYYRSFEKDFGALFKIDNLYEQQYKKHFKKFYSGKPTKRYLRILKLIDQAEKTEIETLRKLKGV